MQRQIAVQTALPSMSSNAAARPITSLSRPASKERKIRQTARSPVPTLTPRLWSGAGLRLGVAPRTRVADLAKKQECLLDEAVDAQHLLQRVKKTQCKGISLLYHNFAKGTTVPSSPTTASPTPVISTTRPATPISAEPISPRRRTVHQLPNTSLFPNQIVFPRNLEARGPNFSPWRCIGLINHQAQAQPKSKPKPKQQQNEKKKEKEKHNHNFNLNLNHNHNRNQNQNRNQRETSKRQGTGKRERKGQGQGQGDGTSHKQEEQVQREIQSARTTPAPRAAQAWQQNAALALNSACRPHTATGFRTPDTVTNKKQEPNQAELQNEMAKQKKLQAVQSKRAFREVSERVGPEKLLLRRLLDSYSDRLVEQKRRELEVLLQAKEKFLATLDSALIDVDRIRLANNQTAAQPTTNEQRIREELAELQDKLAAHPSKYHTNFCLELEMRQAYRERRAYLDPLEDFSRVPFHHAAAVSAEPEGAAQMADDFVRNVRENYEKTVLDVLAKSKSRLDELSAIKERAAEDPEQRRYKDREVHDFFSFVKLGKTSAIRELLAKRPRLVHEIDNVAPHFTSCSSSSRPCIGPVAKAIYPSSSSSFTSGLASNLWIS